MMSDQPISMSDPDSLVEQLLATARAVLEAEAELVDDDAAPDLHDWRASAVELAQDFDNLYLWLAASGRHPTAWLADSRHDLSRERVTPEAARATRGYTHELAPVVEAFAELGESHIRRLALGYPELAAAIWQSRSKGGAEFLARRANE